MNLSEEHIAFRDSLRKFIEAEINPHVDTWEEARIFPAHDLFKKMGDQGFLGVCRPTKFGGLGLDYSFAVVMAETLGHVRCGGVPMAIGVQTDMATPALAQFGSDHLRNEFLTPTIAGDFVVCLGVSEPEAGSDVAGIRSFAKSDGDDYVINGHKMWITNGTQADWMCMLVNTDEGSAHRNKSLVCVPMKTAGISVEKKLEKVGMHSSDTALIHFDDVRIPKRYRIGDEGMGFVYQMKQFQEERLWGTAAGLVPMETAIQETIEYTRERKAFGKPVLDNQVVHFRLAELKTEVEAVRALLYRAVDLHCTGEDVTELASMAKLKAGRLQRQVADNCLQYFGGMGYMHETPISRFYRDSRLLSIGAGTDEVMLSIICKRMGVLPRNA